MPPKKKGKKGKKKKKAVEIDPNALTEVDKTFYELTITDLNRKLARLRSLTAELEVKNEELTQELQKVDEDRSDIIVYLKRMLQEKSDEVKEVQDRLTALEETRENETEEYEQKIQELDEEYKQLQETLTSEIKLLEGKLNALEEFRIQRDELMRKYEQQEVQMDEQEKRHKRELYETEKKFIIGKDKLKKEMEARLLQLSTEFHDATELRIASTTHRVIRENIAINNELEVMLNTHKRLYTDNVKMKERDRVLRQKVDLSDSETKKSLARSKIQVKVIERLNNKNQELSLQVQRLLVTEKQFKNFIQEKEKTDLEMKHLQIKVGLLEQNLHNSRCERAKLEAEIANVKDENDNYVDIIRGTVNAINSTLFISESDSDESIALAKRESLLQNLLTLLSAADDKRLRRTSTESVCSVHTLYTRGDLGFVPKPVVIRAKIPVLRCIECQTGSSLEASSILEDEQELDGLEQKSSATTKQKDAEKLPGEEQSITIIPEEKSSIVFFDDMESIEEEEASFGSEDMEQFMEGHTRSDMNTTHSQVSTVRSKTTTEPATTETEDAVHGYLSNLPSEGEEETDMEGLVSDTEHGSQLLTEDTE